MKYEQPIALINLRTPENWAKVARVEPWIVYFSLTGGPWGMVKNQTHGQKMGKPREGQEKIA